MISFPDIPGQLGTQEIPFLVIEPFDLLGEIGHEEETEQANNRRKQAFNDKDPSPASKAADSIHLADSCGENTTESTSQSGGAEEEAKSLLGFASGIPHTHEIKAYPVSSC